MNLTEKKIDGRVIYEGKILKLELDEVELPDGSMSKRECVRHSGGAAVLYVSDDNVLLVKQFRYLYDKEIYEIPAGKLECGENAAFAADRELEEETGYVCGHMELLNTIYTTVAFCNEKIDIYLARNLKRGRQHLDENEYLNVEVHSLEELKQMIFEGRIQDSKTICGILSYAARYA